MSLGYVRGLQSPALDEFVDRNVIRGAARERVGDAAQPDRFGILEKGVFGAEAIARVGWMREVMLDRIAPGTGLREIHAIVAASCTSRELHVALIDACLRQQRGDAGNQGCIVHRASK